ncbi:hypothetical protein ACK8HH_17110 [Gordonia sp. LUNF6]|uniref:hypothetical protein n=1 Tax=unclassified Gordonia (in: high G+C Gram-positive bacteria) TaxID=2657482 RepID=UPI000A9B1C4C|nr:hypothetical protein [Gordonia sp. QH-12]
MSEVTVKAIQPVLGLADGDVVTIERTPRIDTAIKAGRLVVQDQPVQTTDVGTTSDDPEPVPDDSPQPETAEAQSEQPRVKRVKKLAGLDKDTDG